MACGHTMYSTSIFGCRYLVQRGVKIPSVDWATVIGETSYKTESPWEEKISSPCSFTVKNPCYFDISDRAVDTAVLYKESAFDHYPLYAVEEPTEEIRYVIASSVINHQFTMDLMSNLATHSGLIENLWRHYFPLNPNQLMKKTSQNSRNSFQELTLNFSQMKFTLFVWGLGLLIAFAALYLEHTTSFFTAVGHITAHLTRSYHRTADSK